MATETRGKKSTGRNGANRNGNGNPRVSAKQRAKKKRTKIFIFAAEIIVLLVALVVLWGVLQGENVGRVNIKEEDLIMNMNETVKDNETLKGYRNIALFGVDTTTGGTSQNELAKKTRSDTIMIASVNMDTGEIKLVSVYRDTYLNLSNDTYTKCNSAYAKGGAEMAINMLNMNLDLNITDFVTVGFAGLKDTIDALGGVYIDVDEAELEHINNYQYCMAEDMKIPYTEVKETGYQLLDGLQATAYCRIRYTAGNDFKRAERQREVLQAVAEKAKKADIGTLTTIATDVSKEVYTSLDLQEIIELLGGITNYSIVADEGFPREDLRATGSIGSSGSCVVPVSLSDNVKWLHEFLFNDTDYEVSSELQTYSDKINSDTASYLK